MRIHENFWTKVIQEITRAACALHDRGAELLTNDVTAVKYRPRHVTYIPTDFIRVKRLSLIR